MPVPKPKYPIELTTEEEQELRKLANSRTAPYVKVVRARILLAAYDHPEWSNRQVAEILAKWCRSTGGFRALEGQR